MILRPPGTTRSGTPFPYTTLFRYPVRQHLCRHLGLARRRLRWGAQDQHRRTRRIGVGVGRRQVVHEHDDAAAARRARPAWGPARRVSGVLQGDQELRAGLRSLGEGVVEGLGPGGVVGGVARSEEHTSELQSRMRISYDVVWLNKTKI